MSYSVTYAKKYNNRYIVPIHFAGNKVTEREAVIDTACSTTLVPMSLTLVDTSCSCITGNRK